jgi:protein-L-isoaspartate(D-aspartate) O-methyltransferase
MEHDLALARQRLIDELSARGITDQRVLEAMRVVPRERFVPADLRARAYDNHALPIEAGQSISQPLMVALMTQALGLEGSEVVLEIGTGTGYQTALLAELAARVVTIERVEELARSAEQRLRELGYANIECRVGDGSLGWPPRAPYDAILVTAGAPDVPAPLYRQLAIGGRLVIPVGDEVDQVLRIVIKREEGPEIRDEGGCRFVRLIGDAAWPEELG